MSCVLTWRVDKSRGLWPLGRLQAGRKFPRLLVTRCDPLAGLDGCALVCCQPPKLGCISARVRVCDELRINMEGSVEVRKRTLSAVVTFCFVSTSEIPTDSSAVSECWGV